MSMSTHIYGFRPPTESYKKMFAVYQACEKAGVPLPKEVEEYFDYEVPSEKGMRVDISDAVTKQETGEWDVEINALPKDVTIITFENSW